MFEQFESRTEPHVNPRFSWAYCVVFLYKFLPHGTSLNALHFIMHETHYQAWVLVQFYFHHLVLLLTWRQNLLPFLTQILNDLGLSTCSDSVYAQSVLILGRWIVESIASGKCHTIDIPVHIIFSHDIRYQERSYMVGYFHRYAIGRLITQGKAETISWIYF